jgi:hypothetical protein
VVSDPPRAGVDLITWARDVARTPQKALGIATTILSLIVIGRLTLRPLGDSLPTHFDVCLLCGSTGTANFLLNIGLFVPLGIGLRLSGMRRWTAWTLALLLTSSIEALQFYVVPGRDSDLGDIVANTTGAVIGVAAVDMRRLWLTPPPLLAGRLSGIAALAVCIVAAFVQWALMPKLPHGIYYPQVAPDLPGYSLLDGVVVDATFNGADIGIGRMSAAASEAMRDSLLSDGAVVAVTMQPGTTRPSVAPIVDVHDQSRNEIFLLGRRGDDLIFRIHRRSDALGFHPPSWIVPDAFAPRASAVDTMVVRATTTTGSTAFDVAHRGSPPPPTLHRRIGDGVWEAWRLFIPDNGRWMHFAQWIMVAWLSVLLAPLGYWAGRAARREGIFLSGMTVAMPVVASFAIIPLAAGAPPAALPVWAAGLAVAAITWGIGRWAVG